jgi:nitrogen fixation protein FixH
MRFFRLNDENPFTGWHMLAVVLVFFGTIISVNVVMAVAATGTFPGLVVKNSYVASQHYDELLAKAEAQERAGWHYDFALDGGLIRVGLSRDGTTPARGLSVIAHVGRPSTTREDRMLELASTQDGAYASSEALAPGLWEVDIEAVRRGEIVFRRTQEVFVEP